MNNYYVYIFLDLTKPGEYIYQNLRFDYEPFYVGKGNELRILTSLKRGSNFKMNRIKKISKNNIKAIKIYENLDNVESLQLEKSIISMIGRRDLGLGPLVNLTNGGDGRLYSPHSEETKNKISVTKKTQNLHNVHSDEIKELLREMNSGENNPMFGKTHSKEIRESQSLRVSGINHPMYGKKHDVESLKKIKENRNISQQELNRISIEINSKKVLQYSLNGHFIKEYNSIKDASKETGLSESLIGKTCRGVVKNPKKFIFKFKDESSFIFSNSFKIKIGDKILIEGVYLKLVKRNKQSFIAENENGDLLSFRKKDFDFVWEKSSISTL
jgi:hypothetical protein